MKTKKTNNQILLFDQDSDTITFVKDTLNEFDIIVEKDTEGLDKIIAEAPDIIIADSGCLDESHFPLLNKLSAENLNVPVIITGNLSELAIITAFRKGASDYITKPLDSHVLKERVSVLLNNKNKKTTYSTGEDDFQNLLDNIERDNKELNNLLKINSSFEVSGDSKKILIHLTELAAESMNCEAASIMLVNERENVLEFIVATGDKKKRMDTISIPMGEGIAGWVAMYGETQIVNDTTKDERFTGKVDEESGFVTRQILAIPLKLDGKIIGVLEVINSRDNRVFGDNDVRIINAICDRAATVIETTRLIENQQNYYIQTINILVKAIEKKDIYAEGHPWKVAEFCHKIGFAMNLRETERNDLHFSALLHDIGKLELPSTLFTRRVVSEREHEYMRQHPVKGAKLIEPITLWKSIVPNILYHHEAWDGNGYPFGRSGDSIPLGARIINLTESFSVMRSPNTYKKQMSLKESILEVMRSSNKQFDPEIVKVFIGVLEKDTSRY